MVAHTAEVRDELSMNDFLREYLGMTGTKFGCGALCHE